VIACTVCQRPVRAGYARCYQCALQLTEAGGLLADAVFVVAYAVKGGQLARDLWRYKADRPDPGAAGRLRGLLRGFLADHARCVHAAAPGSVVVVPSGQGREGTHPLAGIVSSCVDLPMVELAATSRAMARGREVSPGWLRVAGGAAGGVAGTSVLVVDDTWVSGGSAQSAAAALKLAGAARVTIMVLGRHLEDGILAGSEGTGPAHACAAHNGRDPRVS
jgi:hypothetical protein